MPPRNRIPFRKAFNIGQQTALSRAVRPDNAHRLAREQLQFDILLPAGFIRAAANDQRARSKRRRFLPLRLLQTVHNFNEAKR